MLIRDMGFSARLVSTSWPLFETYCRIVSFGVFKLIVFAFSNNLSENSKLSAEFVLQLLECMQQTIGGHIVWNAFENESGVKVNILH